MVNDRKFNQQFRENSGKNCLDYPELTFQTVRENLEIIFAMKRKKLPSLK